MFRKHFLGRACLALILLGSLLAGCSKKEETPEGGGNQMPAKGTLVAPGGDHSPSSGGTGGN